MDCLIWVSSSSSFHSLIHWWIYKGPLIKLPSPSFDLCWCLVSLLWLSRQSTCGKHCGRSAAATFWQLKVFQCWPVECHSQSVLWNLEAAFWHRSGNWSLGSKQSANSGQIMKLIEISCSLQCNSKWAWRVCIAENLPIQNQWLGHAIRLTKMLDVPLNRGSPESRSLVLMLTPLTPTSTGPPRKTMMNDEPIGQRHTHEYHNDYAWLWPLDRKHLKKSPKAHSWQQQLFSHSGLMLGELLVALSPRLAEAGKSDWFETFARQCFRNPGIVLRWPCSRFDKSCLARSSFFVLTCDKRLCNLLVTCFVVLFLVGLQFCHSCWAGSQDSQEMSGTFVILTGQSKDTLLGSRVIWLDFVGFLSPKVATSKQNQAVTPEVKGWTLFLTSALVMRCQAATESATVLSPFRSTTSSALLFD